PLLEAALQQFAPVDASVHARVGAAVPPGCGTGTSAAVVVALLAALACARDEPLDAGAIARDAHAVETSLGLQSGVQDQYASAHGGATLIHVDASPAATVHRLAVAAPVVDALDARLVTVYLGVPHTSSAVHEQVIAALDTGAADATDTAERRLAPLRAA